MQEVISGDAFIAFSAGFDSINRRKQQVKCDISLDNWCQEY